MSQGAYLRWYRCLGAVSFAHAIQTFGYVRCCTACPNVRSAGNELRKRQDRLEDRQRPTCHVRRGHWVWDRRFKVPTGPRKSAHSLQPSDVHRMVTGINAAWFESAMPGARSPAHSDQRKALGSRLGAGAGGAQTATETGAPRTHPCRRHPACAAASRAYICMLAFFGFRFSRTPHATHCSLPLAAPPWSPLTRPTRRDLRGRPARRSIYASL